MAITLSPPPSVPDEKAEALLALAGRWSLITNDFHLPQPRSIKIHGTHVAAFIDVDHDAGIRARLDYFCAFPSPNAVPRVTRTVFIDDQTLWYIPFETLRTLTIRAVGEAECRAMGLPGVPMYYTKPDAEHVRLRQLRDLDPFRRPGHPDDVSFSVTYDRPEGFTAQESLWGRLERQTGSDTFECTLLHQPISAPGIKQGAPAEITLLKMPGLHQLVLKPR
jgi:hypothetical protein